MKLAILVLLFLVLRLVPIFISNFPYSYDNAKDSLVMQEMWTYKKPALLGAVTSMEGLYQGPAWYYIMLPLNILLGFDPIASVATVVLLGVLTVILLYRYVGSFEAFLFTISSSVIATQQTAWSPYLTIFSTTWALILFTRLKTKPKTIHLVLFLLSLSLLFHAEIAFAVVFFFLTLTVLIRLRVRPTLAQVILSGCVFILPFLPQAVFEVRHNFLETRSVIRFISNYSSEKSKVQENKSGFARIGEVASGLSQNALRSISPSTLAIPDSVAVILVGFFLFVLYKKRKIMPSKVLQITIPIVIGTFLLYLVLPFKPFYLIGLVPFWIYMFAQMCTRVYPKIRFALGILGIVAACLALNASRNVYEDLATKTSIVYAPKLAAVEEAYRLTSGEPFASYQYVPEVYDYVYQHIYQYTAVKKHRNLPTEYSYAPGQNSYMTTQKLPGDSRTPQSTILIVEADARPQFFPFWWEKMTKGKTIVATKHINEAITVYQLK